MYTSLGALVTAYTKKKELAVTDDASIRHSLQEQVTGLMTERTNLVSEIDKLADRCSKIEKENRDLIIANRELNEQLINFQKEAFEKERVMQSDVDHLKGQIEELRNAKNT